MAEFVVELYVAEGNVASVQVGANWARLAADELTREGTPVTYLRSIFVPDDETCFYLYRADSTDAVREAATRAALQFNRIRAAVLDAGADRREGGGARDEHG